MYTKREELANSLSHAVGIILGVLGGIFLLIKAIKSQSSWEVISVIIYLLGMLSSYISSTLYHGLKKGTLKDLFRKCDHSAIYFHIAASYTPFTLIVLREQGAWGWSLFISLWLAAIIGTYMSFYKINQNSILKTICYVLMGLAVLITLKPLIEVLKAEEKLDALYWLLAGGLAYIIGVFFFAWTSKRYMHTVFHLFVLVGTFCHIISIGIIL